MKPYIFNLETTKIELHCEKSEYAALTDDQKSDLKSAFLWSRSGSCWVSACPSRSRWNASLNGLRGEPSVTSSMRKTQPGDHVRLGSEHEVEVISAGPQNITYWILTGGAKGMV